MNDAPAVKAPEKRRPARIVPADSPPVTQPLRTARGGRIERDRLLTFTFNAARFRGHPGDTLASALLANGVHFVGRSFKYHRPRGIVTAGSEEPNALVHVRRGPGREDPNQRATQIELTTGLEVTSQNHWPSLGFDVGALNDALARFLPAGFYYKTFMWPASFWHKVYEPRIRAAAGLGRAPSEADPDRYTNRFAHCDLLVVGAGPAGLAAALTAARAGARVMLCDEQSEPGGSLLAESEALIDGNPAQEWLEAVVRELEHAPNVTLLPRTQAFGYFAQNFVALQERLTDHLLFGPSDHPRERLWQVRAKTVVLATGAIERPLVFPDNDRPGIMLADAARTYLNRYGVLVGRRIVVATAHDHAYRAGLDLAAAGAEVTIIDLRREAVGELPDRARAAGLAVLEGRTLTGTGGRTRVACAHVGHVAANGRVHDVEKLACDALLMSGGWTPSVHLFSQSRGRLRFDEELLAYLPFVSAQAERSAGGCNGAFGLAECLAEGTAAAAQALEVTPFVFATREPIEQTSGILGALPHGRDPMDARAWVDFQNDVTAKDVELATREGFISIEHVKRYTTTGMATDQGKTSNMNALAIVAGRTGRAIPEVGLTTFRQPYTPVSFGVLAGLNRGDLFEPVRKTPIHGWAMAQGAVFEDVAMWKRARHFPRAGEGLHDAVNRECLQVRKSVGLFDASTLGKIEIVGPDAAEFIDRVYTNPLKALAVGKCRYALQLGENGFIFDDGVVARLATDRFHVTTSTGGAPRVLSLMEDYRQTEWPDLDCWLTSITEEWAVIAVNGPDARALLAPHVEGIDLSNAAFPMMSAAQGRIFGVTTRLFRMSFTGELGYEINVPAASGLDVWEQLWEAGQAFDAVAYGTEAMHVLRAEKGFIIVGQDTDGTVTPNDAGMDWAVSRKKPDFVGKRSLTRPDIMAKGRKQLVGLLTDAPAKVLEEGAQITEIATPAVGTHAIGHVTSAYWSSNLNRSIALALVEDGRARKGTTVHIPMQDGTIAATVSDTVFYDPQGERARG